MRDGKLHLQSYVPGEQLDVTTNPTKNQEEPTNQQPVDISLITGRNLITGQTVTLHDYMAKLQRKMHKDTNAGLYTDNRSSNVLSLDHKQLARKANGLPLDTLLNKKIKLGKTTKGKTLVGRIISVGKTGAGKAPSDDGKNFATDAVISTVDSSDNVNGDCASSSENGSEKALRFCDSEGKFGFLAVNVLLLYVD